MAHAIGQHFGKHPHLSRHSPPHGAWKFGLAAIIAVAIGVLLTHSPLLERETRAATPAPAAPVMSGPAVPAYIVSPAKQAQVEAAVPAPVIEASQILVARAATTKVQQLAAPPAAESTAQNIRNVDFVSLPAMQALVRQLGGRVDAASIKYADLTGDGNEEAVVPITSDGTSGNLAFVVFTERAGGPEAILTRMAGPGRSGLIVTFDRGQLAETSGVYGPSDANCCPSQIVKTYFRWDGQNLVYDRADTITIPQGKQAD